MHSNLKYIILAISSIALLGTAYLLFNSGESVDAKELENIFIIYNGNGAYLMNGTGEKTPIVLNSEQDYYYMAFPRKWPTNYFLLKAEKSDFTPYDGTYYFYDAIANEKTKVSDFMNKRLPEAKVSPDGNLIASKSGGLIVVTEINSEKDILKINYTNDLTGIDDKDFAVVDKIAWVDNNHLAVYTEGSMKGIIGDLSAIQSINLSNKTISITCVGRIAFFYGGIIDDDFSKGAKPDCMNSPEAKALFGSEEWPVERLIPSTDTSGRYYFYERWNEATALKLTKTWIEGYDLKLHQTFHVYTIQSYWGDLTKGY